MCEHFQLLQMAYNSTDHTKDYHWGFYSPKRPEEF